MNPIDTCLQNESDQAKGEINNLKLQLSDFRLLFLVFHGSLLTSIFDYRHQTKI